MNILTKKLLLATAITLALGSSQAMASESMAAKEQGSSLTNARQEAQIVTTYTLNPYLRSHDLSVAVHNGKATLTGKVEDDVHKELAGAIAAGVQGVSSVDNQITVDANYKAQSRGTNPAERSFGDVVDDATITASVKSKLLWSKHTEGMDTKVITKDGKVELSGSVANQQAKQQAEQLAKNTAGVRSVDNQLQIKDKAASKASDRQSDTDKGSMMADTWITTKVKSTYMYSSNVTSSDISVTTDDGIVTLAGSVSSGAEKALAIELAQNIRGVKSVSSKQLVYEE
ncbi:BON domain-containing protein [Alkalimonas sp.]|uniref:BON domain-containing protein n=1 Tax=Alkalimonas sp. TaxID=1872453 RepID=UPI00263BD682|nr:BON domain-containing protein [Alkalimonas sp.]MCC5827359.1 BON domain-containing protein [Alkalimonas sp.]